MVRRRPRRSPEPALAALGADHSYLQRHVAVRSPITSGSTSSHSRCRVSAFLRRELILDIARFWSSIASFDDERGRYEIRGVMGPDEFHDGYPDSATPGLTTTPIPTSCRVGAVPGAGGARSAVRRASRRAHDAAGFVGGGDRALGRYQPQDVCTAP